MLASQIKLKYAIEYIDSFINYSHIANAWFS